MDLEQHELELARVQADDFRSSNLWALVGKHIAPGTVLDVGCGGGGMVAWLLRRGYDARGIDENDAIVGAARTFLSESGLDAGRIEAMPLEVMIERKQPVDNVISMDCIEHIVDDAAAFHNLVRLCRPGGRILVTVPAMPVLYSERDARVGHHRRYTPVRLRALAAGQPVHIDDLRYWNLLGTLPTLFATRVLKRPLDENFRFGTVSTPRRMLRRGLTTWFRVVENRIRPPVGMTLFMAMTRMPESNPAPT